MELFNLFFFFLLFFSFSSGRNEESMSVRYFNVLKGICILMVFIGHLSKEYQGLLLYKLFCSLGAFAVPAFFFISGYGLMWSWRHKVGYAHGFLIKRVFPIILNYTIACIIWILYKGEWPEIPWLDIILCNYFVPFSWYIFAIVFLYVSFFIAIKLFSTPLFVNGFVVVILTIYLILQYVLRDYVSLVGDITMYAFVLGLIYSVCMPNMLTKGNACVHNRRILLCMALIFLVLWLATLGYKQLHLPHLLIKLGWTVLGLMFPIVAIMILNHIKIIRFEKFWIFLQKNSLQMYLLHGIVFYALEPYRIASTEVWIFVVFCSTLLSSYFISIISQMIIKIRVKSW